MNVEEILEQASSSVAADRVFGTPIERDGVTVVPVAKVFGGGGGGSDDDDDGDGGGGGGGGFGMYARPAGALIVGADGSVRWKGTLDLTRIVIGGQLVGIAYFLFSWLTERSKARAAMKATVAAAAIERVGRRNR